MKRYITIIILFVTLHITGWAVERGVPFFKNYTASTYKAYNRNYDIACDNYGTVFVANFEGLLYYDGATWRKIYTPGISRVTCLAKGANNRIWFGGYNVFGYLVADIHGHLKMELLMSDANNTNDMEVKLIKVANNVVYFITTKGKVYQVKDNKKITPVAHGGERIFKQAIDSITSFQLPDLVKVSYKANWGLQFTMPDNTYFHLSETDGLVSNDIQYITFDGLHSLWAATSKGIFCTEVATPYSRVTDSEGLKGEVNCINEIGNTLYIGTNNGLFTLYEGHISQVKEINTACWDLVDNGHNQLVAPTSQGLYIISGSGLRKLTNTNTLSAYVDNTTDEYIVGEIDGVYRVSPSGKRVKVATVEKIMYITPKGNNLILKSIYGLQWQIPTNATTMTAARCLRRQADPTAPRLYYDGPLGRVWKTDPNGTNLQVSNNNNELNLTSWINPLRSKVLNTLHVCKDGNIIAGGDFGIIIIDSKAMMSLKISNAEQPYIRQIIAMGDSVVWGGYSRGSLKPLSKISNISLPSSCHEVTVTFSTRFSSLIYPTQYRYRIDGGQWSQWSEETSVTYKDPYWGRTKIEIQAKDIYDRLSEISTVTWTVKSPWYMSIWAVLFYIIIFIYIITLFFRWRESKLEHDNMKLEGLIAKRTSELSAAYDKQQKISAELSDTLDDLKRTQNDLVRMERTATAGKLTQGLIDRILNPINYINNFSKLTSGLAKDLKEDIEDEKDNMTEDNYEDCEDILDMMNQNLSKIEEHGVNTTRTLRAMEAMLNNSVGNLVIQDICPLCHQAVKVTKEHFKDEVAKCNINISETTPDHSVMLSIDAESMNRVLLSLLSNSIYAIAKKYSQAAYSNAEINICIKQNDGHATITIHDNGIGIEDTIKDKVFDPFFTTKPTGEASGVGLYLVKEIINDHHGTITLNSEKGEFCEFIITI